jgi:hypothetical protein
LQVRAAYQLRPRLLRVRVLVASRGQFSGITAVYQAAEEKSNGCSVESGPGCLGSMSVCDAVEWVKLSETWPKFKFFDFHKMLKNLLEGQQKVLRVTKIYVL